MMKNAMGAMGRASRDLQRNWRGLVLCFGLYCGLLLVLYAFFATAEASLWQLLLTFLLATGAFGLFFILQTIGVSYTQRETQPIDLLRFSLRNFWKLILVTLPGIVLVGLAIYFVVRAENYLLATGHDSARTATSAVRGSARSLPHTAHWLEITLSALRFLLSFFFLPLVAIHLWIATVREGLGSALRNVGRLLRRALAPDAVLAYAIGCMVFGFIPYFLLFTRTHSNHPWAEMGMLGTRLALAGIFSFLGWMWTLGALTQMVNSDDHKSQ